ncbi:MAG TPA: ABC transporter permease [Blastocatellia bacterium]|nr:ABC transporter permease [Blastocatellia bacterium]
MPDWQTEIRRRLAGLKLAPAREDEIVEELSQHLDDRYAERLAGGASPQEARRAALAELSGEDLLWRGLRRLEPVTTDEPLVVTGRRRHMMSDLWQDLRYAARMLRKQPGFTLIAVLTLALGIGANTAVFSVVNTLLLRPLPFRDPNRLVWISSNRNAGSQAASLRASDGNLSSVTTQVGHFLDWRSMNQSFEDMAAYFAFFDYGSYTLTGSGEPERLRGVGVSQNFLDLLGVTPARGRGFTDEECVWNGAGAAMLTHAFWERRFGADPRVVGSTVILNNKPTTVVGVLPPSFDFSSAFTPASPVDILVPFPLSEETNRWGNTLAVIARLKPGVTMESAQAEMDTLTAELQKAHPERNTNGAKLTSLQEQISGRFRSAFVVLLCAVACVLLVTCTNLSNLLLARASSRRKEIAVRIALGADRSRLVRQMLTESLLLAGCGAALGLPLAFLATRMLAATSAINIPLLRSVQIDATALVFTLIAAIATGLLFGIVPALQVSRLDVHENLKDASRGSSEGGRGGWIRNTLVVTEVALACVLLVGAGLLIRSFLRLLDVDPGFRAEHAASWRIEMGPQYETPAQQNAFYEAIVRKVEAIPGVESVGLTDALPLGRNRSWGVRAKGETYAPGTFLDAYPRIIDPGYIRTMKIPLRAGREFTAHDTADSQKVLIVNETMAAQLWPGRDAVGQIALLGRQEWQVVGVVGNVRHSNLEQEASLEMYLPVTQAGAGSMDMVVRATLPLPTLAPSVRAALASVDAELPTGDFQPLEQIVERAISPRRFITLLLGGFSGLALVLASLGIYGVISYSVTQRTQEIGIRMALGAQALSVLKLIIGQGVRLAAIGLVIGLAASLAITRVMSALLFGVKATDPLTFAGIALLLGGVAFVACYIPARRATKVDPLLALRYE